MSTFAPTCEVGGQSAGDLMVCATAQGLRAAEALEEPLGIDAQSGVGSPGIVDGPDLSVALIWAERKRERVLERERAPLRVQRCVGVFPQPRP
jgi:hypothetical protein